MDRFVIGAAAAALLAFTAPSFAGPEALDPSTVVEWTKKREPTKGQLAARERQKKCAVEWKQAKAEKKTGSQKWPQFWSACNKRLKGETA